MNLLPKPGFFSFPILTNPASSLSDDVSLFVKELFSAILSPKPAEPRRCRPPIAVSTKKTLTARISFIAYWDRRLTKLSALSHSLEMKSAQRRQIIQMGNIQ